MIATHCKGGLGNQLFQYAAGRALALRHGVELVIDPSWYGHDVNMRAVQRNFDLPAFRINARVLRAPELGEFGLPSTGRRVHHWLATLQRWRVGRRTWHDDGMGMNTNFSHLGPESNLIGYFQHPDYFAGIEEFLRRELVLVEAPPDRVRQFARALAEGPSVCIQVRRSDFATNESARLCHGILSDDYYRLAWTNMVRQFPSVVGYVFGDDFGWAEELFCEWPNVKVVSPEWDGPAYLHKFHLMQSCRHFIIANSTWGWWAAWLGAQPGSRVIMPAEWLRGRTTKSLGLALAGWQTL